MTFTPAQKQAVSSNMAYLSKYLDSQEIVNLRNMLDRTDLDIIHCHSIVACISELHERLSFNGRISTVQELQKLIKKYDSAAKN